MTKSPVSVGQEVDLLIMEQTGLGFKARFGETEGVLYHNEIFQSLRTGQRIKGYVRKIREDGKIDLGLHKTGHQGAEPTEAKILELLKNNGGFYELDDKSSPEMIYRLFGTSKKKYKIALGMLYKRRLISIDEDGIRLISCKTPSTKKNL